jgi:hypothetical protein
MRIFARVLIAKHTCAVTAAAAAAAAAAVTAATTAATQIMQDLSELKSGHRDVPDAALDWTFKSMDREHKGYIDKHTFVKYGKK